MDQRTRTQEEEIKDAINADSESSDDFEQDSPEQQYSPPQQYDSSPTPSVSQSSSQLQNGMQPSILSQEPKESEVQEEAPVYYQPEPVEAYQAPQYPSYSSGQGYDQYQQYSSAISPDTITEIAEQITDEKILALKSSIEKSLDTRNSLQSKIDYLDERVKRIEKILDRLQLSILQKVGEYLTNVDDIKKELIETQKSIKSIHKPHSHPHQHHSK